MALVVESSDEDQCRSELVTHGRRDAIQSFSSLSVWLRNRDSRHRLPPSSAKAIVPKRKYLRKVFKQGLRSGVKVKADVDSVAARANTVDCSRNVLAALRLEEFPLQRRLNVTADGSTDTTSTATPNGFCLGAVKTYGRGVRTSRNTRLREPLVRLLCHTVREVWPGFAFTSIQVNKSYASSLHVDSGNLGPSLVICLGDYTRGELYVHGVGKVNVHNRWQMFDGNVPHLTCPFEGERFCVIYFSNQSYGLVPSADVAYQHDLGFKWPKPGLRKANYGEKRLRLCKAAAALPHELAECVCQHSLKRRPPPVPSACAERLGAWMEANGGILPSQGSSAEEASLARYAGRLQQNLTQGPLSRAKCKKLERFPALFEHLLRLNAQRDQEKAEVVEPLRKKAKGTMDDAAVLAEAEIASRGFDAQTILAALRLADGKVVAAKRALRRA